MTKIKVFVSSIFFIFFTSAHSQESEQLTIIGDFSVTIENSDTGLNLICNKGCDWKTLSVITSIEDGSNEIDNFGIICDPDEKLIEASSFNLSIKKTINGIAVVGNSGTSWESLDLSLRRIKKVTINEDGRGREK